MNKEKHRGAPVPKTEFEGHAAWVQRVNKEGNDKLMYNNFLIMFIIVH